jgi:hypothetical protein
MTVADYLRESQGVEYGVDSIFSFDYGDKKKKDPDQEPVTISKSEESVIRDRRTEELVIED